MPNPIYWQIMARRNRGFYGNANGDQIGYTQNGDSSMGRFTGYDRPRMGGDNQYDNRYPSVDDDRVRNMNGSPYMRTGGNYNGEQANGYPQQDGQRDFQIRKGGI